VRVKGWSRDSTLVVVCVNTVNKPLPLEVTLPDLTGKQQAEVMFEDREVKIAGSRIRDMIDAFGTRVFRISLRREIQEKRDTLNMLVDPGFEYLPVPGVPSATYARIGKDRGATYFVDSRVAHSGGHSVRLVTPEDGAGISLSLFPVYLQYGHTYRFSLWAKAAPREDTWSGRGFFYRVFHKKPPPPSFTVTAPGLAEKTFPLTTEWKEYEMFITPSDSSDPVVRTFVTFSQDTRGTAWFDDVSLVPVILMKTEVAEAGNSLRIVLQTPCHRGSSVMTMPAGYLISPLRCMKVLLF